MGDLFRNIISTRTILVDGREFAYERIFFLDGKFYCKEHAPKDSIELPKKVVEINIHTWLDRQQVSENLEAGRFSSFPVKPYGMCCA